MAKIYGQLIKAALENTSSSLSGTIAGLAAWNTTSLLVEVSDGTNVRALLRNDQKAVIGNNGTANNNIRFHRGAAGVLQFVQGGDATAEGTLSTALNQISGRIENYANASLPAAGNAGRLAWVTDQTVVKIDNGSAWIPVGSGGGGGALRWVEAGNAPISDIENESAIYLYTAGGDQGLWATVKIPESYVPGSQIKLLLPFYSPSTSGTGLLRAMTTLIQKNTDAISDTTDQYTSTNSARTIAAPANKVFLETLDLTNASGQINSVAVAAGDILKVKLYRDTDTDTADLRALVYGAEVKFTP